MRYRATWDCSNSIEPVTWRVSAYGEPTARQTRNRVINPSESFVPTRHDFRRWQQCACFRNNLSDGSIGHRRGRTDDWIRRPGDPQCGTFVVNDRPDALAAGDRRT